MDTDLDPEFLAFSEVICEIMEKQMMAVSRSIESRLGDLWSARVAVLAVIGSIHSRPDREFPVEHAKGKIWRASAHAAVTQGIPIIERAISSACYAQAAALVRQEIEAVELLRGIRAGKQKSHSTPRLKALKHLGRPYKQLTGLAHLSDPDLLIHLADAVQSGLDYQLNEKFERYLFCLHLVALVGIGLDAAEMRPVSNESSLSGQEEAWLSAVCGLLEREGFLGMLEDDYRISRT